MQLIGLHDKERTMPFVTGSADAVGIGAGGDSGIR